MNKDILSGIIAMLIGVFTIFCATKDYDFFMNHHKAKFFVRIFGRDGTRIFYSILGVVLMILGLLIIF